MKHAVPIAVGHRSSRQRLECDDLSPLFVRFPSSQLCRTVARRSPNESADESAYLFSLGGAGDSPAPLGDPPSGTDSASLSNLQEVLHSTPLAVPSGGSPDGTGQWPVLPPLNTYKSARSKRFACSREQVPISITSAL
jgi:hypothetical protein